MELLAWDLAEGVPWRQASQSPSVSLGVLQGAGVDEEEETHRGSLVGDKLNGFKGNDGVMWLP